MAKKDTAFHLLVTGGTIDSYYDTDRCTVICHDRTVLADVLARDCHVKQESYELTLCCMKDSREVTDEDRAGFVHTIMHSSHKAIVLTHGSFTIFETARFLESHLGETDKTIVLTGALRPIDGFVNSDGLFNLGASILAAKNAKAGVYICIEGKLLTPQEREVWH